MPRLLERLPKYRRHATGQAVVTLNSRDFYLGPYKSKASRLQYDRLVSEWLANQRRLPSDPDDAVSITDLAAAYWTHAETYYVKDGRPTCLHGIKTALRFLRTYYGDADVAEFGPLALKALQHQMVEEGYRHKKNKRAGKYSRRYVNFLIDHLRRAFKWGVSQELVPVSVHQALTTVPGLKEGRTKAVEHEPVQPVADAIVDATLPQLPPVVDDMVRFQRLTGCRPGEVCQLRPCDLDRNGDVWQYTPKTHKTKHRGKQRIILIGPKAQAVLRPYLLRDSQSFCFSPAESRERRYQELRDNRKSKVQPSQQDRSTQHPKKLPGARYSKDSYNRAIRYACDKLDRDLHKSDPTVATSERLHPRWHANQLRHTAGTEIRRMYGIEAAQVVLGHVKADVTEIYAERDLLKAAAVMREVG